MQPLGAAVAPGTAGEPRLAPSGEQLEPAARAKGPARKPQQPEQWGASAPARRERQQPVMSLNAVAAREGAGRA